MKKIFLHIFILIILSSVLRFIWLDRLPIGISGDELDYVLNAKAVAITGSDISGLWSPFSLSTPPYEVPKAELSYLIVSPFVGLTPLSLFSARFPYAFFSVLFVLLLYLISSRLFSSNVGFIVGIVASINPWAVYFGRTSYDVPLAIYLYFLSFYLLLITKKNKIFFAFPFFFLAFFFYIGTKIIYLPFLIICIVYAWLKAQKKNTRKYLLLFLICLIPLLFFIFSLKFNPVSFRAGDLISLKNPVLANAVDAERRLSIQTPLTIVFSNKLSLLTKQILNNYLGVFSTGYLFLYGENSPFISLWYHGIYYYIDFFFLLIGLCTLFAKQRKIFWLLVSIILIAPLPSITSNVGISYSIRASIMFPIFIIFIGYGIWQVISFRNSKSCRIILSGIISLVYFVLLLNYINILFFRNPIYSSDAFGFSGREVVKYIQLAKKTNQKVLFVDKPSNFVPYFFKQYLFYAKRYDKNTAPYIALAIKNNSYLIDNFEINECPKAIDNNTIIISVPDSPCKLLSSLKHPLSISRLADGGSIYSIYSDTICSKYRLNKYPSNITLADLKVEGLSEKTFCEKFISNL